MKSALEGEEATPQPQARRCGHDNRSCYSYGAVNVNQLAILTVNDIHSAGNPCDIRG